MEGLVFPLEKAILIVGRDKSAGIQLNHEFISENHAAIVGINGQFVLKDKGSTNGTFVNGKKVKEKILSHNDMIHFGPYQFQADMEWEPPVQAEEGQEVALVDGTGQGFHRSVTLQKGTGLSAKSPIQIMMAGKNPPSPALVSSKSNRLLLVGLAGALIVVAVLGFRLHQVEQDCSDLENQSLLDRQTNMGLQKAIASSALLFQNLEAKLAKSVEDLRVSKEEISSNENELRQLRKQLPIPNAGSQEKAASMAVQQPDIVKSLPQAKVLPLLKFPAKITLSKETTIPLVTDGKVVGSLKVPKDKVLSVRGDDKENVIIDMEGTPAAIPKENTDFQAALDLANLTIKQGNELRQFEQDVLNKKLLAEKAIADKQASDKREQLMASKIKLSLRLIEITKEGVIGVVVSGQSAGVKAILSGPETQNLVVGETWTGEAYQMGVLKKSDSLRYRQYTTNLEEFEAFKNQEAKSLSP